MFTTIYRLLKKFQRISQIWSMQFISNALEHKTLIVSV